jgi:hypothetical protein
MTLSSVADGEAAGAAPDVPHAEPRLRDGDQVSGIVVASHV